MTKKEQETIKQAAEKIERIIKYDNKNLYTRQLYFLDDCLTLLKGLLNKKKDEIL